jgi:hypothetical protein
MGKFEWMELETLSNEIAHSQSRLDAARGTQNHGLVTLLQREIAETVERRARVLAGITKELGVAGSARSRPSPVPVQKIEAEVAQEEQQRGEQVEGLAATVPASPEPTPSPNPTEGVSTVWDKLTRADIERAKQGLVTRRSEMLARHAEELKALDAEQSEIDVIERAIGAFAIKFKIGGSAEVVALNAEHNAHSQAGERTALGASAV